MGTILLRAEIRDEMNALEEKMGEEAYKIAKDLGLEANKSLKLESNGQHGHYFRVTLKVKCCTLNESPINLI